MTAVRTMGVQTFVLPETARERIADNLRAHDSRASERAKKWRMNNPGYAKARYADDKKYRNARREYNRLYREKYREVLSVRQKLWYADNKERVNAERRAKHAENPDRSRDWSRKWRFEHPEKIQEYKQREAAAIKSSPERRAAVRNRDRLRRYGSSGVALLAKQQNKCAVCGCELDEIGRRPSSAHLDHDHETGVVRGWLCARCNAGIGMFGDDLAVMELAIKYLKSAKNRS